MELKDYHKEMDRIENNIGRYPIGFRHYENFDNYRVIFPDSTIEHYTNEMNKQCEFHEFKDIFRQSFLE